MLELLKSKGIFNGQLSSNPDALADQISKLSSKQILTGLADNDCGKGLGICRTAQTSGKGWNSHGSVSCHSYGCGVNYAVAPAPAGLAQAFH
mmetsp:Transcript_19965/g.41876  ORF Transcript_19965/g.41876 Transcript_19965/m.41876 type:complete len:92 (-) Transcript_19965:61-336(-)